MRGVVVTATCVFAVVTPLLLVAGCQASPQGAGSSGGSSIGPEGGRVDGPDGVYLDVPPGALDAPTAITISVRPAPLSPPSEWSGPTYIMAPDGLEFHRPATMHYPLALLAGHDADRAFLYLHAEGTDELEALPTTVDAATNSLTGDVWHFTNVGVFVLSRTVTLADLARTEGLHNCSTALVAGLSQQLIHAFSSTIPLASIAGMPRVRLRDVSHPTVQAPLRTLIEQAVADPAAAKLDDLVITSAMRSVAQQYLLNAWVGHCEIKRAADPAMSLSNHFDGTAIDVHNYDAWQAVLTAHELEPLPASVNDPVHFDAVDAVTIEARTEAIAAFQRVWNAYHPCDQVLVTGNYADIASRLASSPAIGFSSADLQTGCAAGSSCVSCNGSYSCQADGSQCCGSDICTAAETCLACDGTPRCYPAGETCCGPSTCDATEVCLGCDGVATCYPAGTTCCGETTCDSTQTCLSCDGTPSCAAVGSTCCDTDTCDPGQTCLQCGTNRSCESSGSFCCSDEVCASGQVCETCGDDHCAASLGTCCGNTLCEADDICLMCGGNYRCAAAGSDCCTGVTCNTYSWNCSADGTTMILGYATCDPATGTCCNLQDPSCHVDVQYVPCAPGYSCDCGTYGACVEYGPWCNL